MKVSFRSHPEVLHYQEGLIAQNFFSLIFPHLHGVLILVSSFLSYDVQYWKKTKLNKISLSFHTYLLIFPTQLQSLHAGIGSNCLGTASN